MSIINPIGRSYTLAFLLYCSIEQTTDYKSAGAVVAPFPYQSGTSIHGRTKVHPLADKKLKSLMNMCALSAVRFDKELKIYYERKVKEGKPKMLVMNNVRCKLLGRVFAVINRKTPFINTFKFAS